MEHTINRSVVRDLLQDGGVCVLAVAALPILAILALTLRGVLILAVALAAVSCAVMYPISGRFREWFRSKAELEFRHRGVRLAPDVLLHPAHSWARWGPTVTVGADDLLLSVIGRVEAVDLPSPGMHVDAGAPLFRVRRGERCIDVCSPISGVVRESNEALRVHPRLMNNWPFGQGWAARLDPDDSDPGHHPLLSAHQARSFYTREIDQVMTSTWWRDESASEFAGDSIGDPEAWNQLTKMFQQHAERGSANCTNG